jgi:peptidoglycan hydrolase-like protein with peptidoglycan-binding domain
MKYVSGLLCVSLLFLSACAKTQPPSLSPAPAVPPASKVAPPAPPPVQAAPQPDPEVEWAQQTLQEQGYDPGPIDGLMGRKTRDALGQFQRDHDIPKSGKVDTATKAALEEYAPKTE